MFYDFYVQYNTSIFSFKRTATQKSIPVSVAHLKKIISRRLNFLFIYLFIYLFVQSKLDTGGGENSSGKRIVRKISCFLKLVRRGRG
jgi:hypothetical protein